MSAPPSYPRVPHVVPGRGSRDDLLVDSAEAESLVGRPVVVEEKLDGANVVVWLDGERIACATRSGAGGRDRAGQLGPLKAWLAERSDQVRRLLGAGGALYGEWLLLTHSVAYDALGSHLVGLDLLRPGGGFDGVDRRNQRLRAAGIPPPPELFRGHLEHFRQLDALIGPSAVGSDVMEGIVIRTLDGGPPRIAKLVRPGFAVLDDDAWRAGRPRNRVGARPGPAA